MKPTITASQQAFFRERRIRKNAEALSVRVPMAEHECEAKQFWTAWMKEALRGYMPKNAPWAKPLTTKQIAANAEALQVRKGISQAERNRELKDFAAALRYWAKKFAREHGGVIMYEDIDAFIRRFRKCSAAREGGAGADPPRKAKK